MLILSEHDAARLGIDGATPRAKRGRNTRPDIPSAGRAASTGLTPLLVNGWSIVFVVGMGYRMYKINTAMDTGWHATEHAVCAAAKALIS